MESDTVDEITIKHKGVKIFCAVFRFNYGASRYSTN